MKLRFWERDEAEPSAYFATDDYQDGSGARSILLALFTFLATLAILAGLFFAGRWVYHRFQDDKKDDSTSQTADTDQTGQTPVAGTTPTPTPTPANGDSEDDTPLLNDGPQSGNATSNGSTSGSGASLSATGSSEASSNSLPNTGMDGPEELR